MATPAHARAVRPHRALVATLLTIATLIGFVACFDVWLNRQLLNTNNWTNTSGRLLEDPHVQQALSIYLVDELFKSVDVSAKLQTALPSELQGLAGPLSAGLRQVAGQAVPQLLATAQVQELWRRSNRAAHAQLLRVLNGGTKTLSTSGGEVALNLHELLTELAAQLGLSSQLESARSKLAGGTGAAARSAAQEKLGVTLPADGGRIVILRVNQLRTAQDIVKDIRGLSLVLPLLSLALFALALWLAAGWRRVVLRTTGWCFFGIGVALLLIRRVGGEEVVSGLVSDQTFKAAAQASWSIGTSLLYAIAAAMILYGLVLVCAAWLVGPTRSARFLRHVAAPWLRHHVAGSYAVAGLLLLLVVLWGPTQATRELLPVLGFAALAALGVAALRRQTAMEFPDAASGQALAELRGSWPFGRSHEPDGTGARTSSPPAEASAATAERETAELS
jgi:hypothetical protein